MPVHPNVILLNSNTYLFSLSFVFVVLIDRDIDKRSTIPNTPWKSVIHNGEGATIKYKVRVVCDQYYYGTNCTVLCRSRNDKHGHYTCGDSGKHVCMPGWSGSYCNTGMLYHSIFHVFFHL